MIMSPARLRKRSTTGDQNKRFRNVCLNTALRRLGVKVEYQGQKHLIIIKYVDEI